MGWIVRNATTGDKEVFTTIAEQFATESPMYRSIPFDRDYYGAFLDMVFQSEQHVALICEKDGIIAGAIMGMVYGHLYSPVPQASDLGFFVKPEFRGSRAAPLLEKGYRSWAGAKGAKKISLGDTTGNEKVRALYERLGYTYVGSNYAMLVDQGE